MKIQDYNNHKFYYFPHHFVFYSLLGILLFLSASQIFMSNGQALLWTVITALIAMIFFLALMLRQHYALGNQNRTVRLEMRFRYYVLTHQRFELLEDKLSLSQVFALRFAPDEELPALVDRAVKERLTGDQIKKAIKNWLPDTMRV